MSPCRFLCLCAHFETEAFEDLSLFLQGLSAPFVFSNKLSLVVVGQLSIKRHEQVTKVVLYRRY